MNKGQGLLELVIVMGITMLIVVAFVSVTVVSIKTTDYSKKKAQAAKYGEEGMEMVRVYRDSNSWATFCVSCRDLTLQSALNFPSISPFSRSVSCTSEIAINCLPGDLNRTKQLKVIIEVSWSDSKGTHKSQNISNFGEWQ